MAAILKQTALGSFQIFNAITGFLMTFFPKHFLYIAPTNNRERSTQ